MRTERASNSKEFLLKCRRYGFTPKFIHNWTNQVRKIQLEDPFDRKRMVNDCHNFHTKILNTIINSSVKKWKKLQKQNEAMRTQLLHLNSDHNNTATIVKIHEDSLFEWQINNSVRLENKFTKLRTAFHRTNNINTEDKWLKNLTSLTIPDDTKWMMSLGVKFSPPTKRAEFPIFSFIAETERCIETIADRDRRELIRAKISNALSKGIARTNTVTPLDRYIIEAKKSTIQFLKENKEVILVQADKGGASVLMYRDEYHRKMNEILSDPNYELIAENPLHKLRNKSNSLINELEECGIITHAQSFNMKRNNTHLARIYAAPKIHKPNIPLRPIVDYSESPASQLSIFLKECLNQINNNKYDVCNSIEVTERIANIKIKNEETLVSFD